MKKIIFLFVGLFLGALLCCKAPKNSVSTPTNTKIDTMLNSKYWLVNRIPDCDKAIDYMDSIITPVLVGFDTKSTQPLNYAKGGLSTIENEIFNSENLYTTQQYLYYINLDCFINKSTSSVFKVFCPKEEFDNLVKLDSVYIKANKKWGFNYSVSSFNALFRFEHGRVIEAWAGNNTVISE